MAGSGRRMLCWFAVVVAAAAAAAKVVDAAVRLVADGASIDFPCASASFAPSVGPSGISGVVYVTQPIDACNKLEEKSPPGNSIHHFALLMRGGCSFDAKVRNVQNAGFDAAIVYDTKQRGLIAMQGNSTGIHIYAVFVSNTAGNILRQHAGQADSRVWILPESAAQEWFSTAVAISILALPLLVLCLLWLCCRWFREGQPNHIPSSYSSELCSTHSRQSLVDALPCIKYSREENSDASSSQCAICLDDYEAGDKLRLLPCSHRYHAECVDTWLIKYKMSCPICKRDLQSIGNSPPSAVSPPAGASESPV